MELDQPDGSVTERANIPGFTAAGCLGVVIVADMIYGGFNHREPLLSWTHLLMAALALFALFNNRITEFVLSKDGVTFKQKGVTFKQKIEAAALLATAEANRPTGPAGADKQDAGEQAKQIAYIVGDATARSTARGLANASVLWVDDRPSNNVNERQSLEALGIRFTISTSTEDAMEKVRARKFDLIISDMGRPPDARAGYTLLDALKKLGDPPPFVIYAGSASPEHRAETKERGGWGTTNRPQELFQMVLSALKSRGIA